MTGRVGILVNPAAGRGKGARFGPKALAAVAAAGYDVVDLTAHDLATARAGAAEFVTSPGARALVAVGGDGVVNLAVNTILAHAPELPLAVLAAGTGNDTARTLGLELKHTERAVAALVASLAGPVARIDAGSISDDAGHRRYFVNVASAGVDAAVNARSNSLAWPKGPARYVVGLVREVLHFRGYAVAVTVDGVPAPESGTLAAIANGRSIGGGMLIAPQADWTDGLLDVVTARAVGRFTLLGVFPRVYRGTHTNHPAVTVTRGREVLLSPVPGSRLAPPPELHADGEPVGELPLRLRVLPGALRVLGLEAGDGAAVPDGS